MSQESAFAGETAAPRLLELQLDLLDASPQVRKHFDEESLKELSKNIGEHGIIQPIVARPKRDGRYEIVAGERRMRAGALAELKTAPVLVRPDLVGKDLLVLQLTENIQRENLSMADECAAVTTLVETLGAEATAEKLGRSLSWVSKRSTIKQLPAPIKDLVEDGKVKDLEVVQGLGQLAKLNATKAFELARMARTVENIALLAPHQQPTRENIGALVRAEKEAAERKAQDKIERDAAKNDPAAIKAKKRDADAREERKKAQARLQQLKDDGARLEDDTLEAIGKALAIKIPARSITGGRGMSPVEIHMDYLQEHMKLPATVDGVAFTLRADGPVSLIKKACQITDYAQMVGIQIREVTVAEAEQIAAILGDKRISVGFGKRVTGKDLRRYIERAGQAKHQAKAEKREAAKDGPEYQLAKLKEFLRGHVTAIGGKEARLNKVTAKEMYAAYEAFCEANKLQPLALNDNAYGAAILAHAGGRISKKRMTNGYVYVGCALS